MAPEVSEQKSRTARLSRTKVEVLRRISFLEHKAVIDYRDVYHLIREFFKAYLEKEYEFTVKELRDELQKIYIPADCRDDVAKLLEQIEEMEYSLVEYPRSQLLAILTRFRRLVMHLVRSYQKERGWLARIRSWVLKEEERPIIISELPTIENTDQLHIHLNVMLERLYLFMEQKKLHKAKHQYQELNTLYNTAPDDIKQEFFPLIDQTYNDLAEKLQKK